MQIDRSEVVRPSSDAGLTIETELVVYIWKIMQWLCFSLANVCIIIKDTSGFLKDYSSNYKNQSLSGLKVDILHLNFQWESLDIEGEVAIV
jgi:hypothetical protein